MRKWLAWIFRSLNTLLLRYRSGFINKLLKISYLISIYFFKNWINKKRSEQLFLVSNFDGHIKIEVDISKKMGAALFWTGFHEFNEMRFLHSFLREDMVFVDIGANQGEYSLFAANRLRKGEVLAFEPMWMFFARLNNNIKLNGFTNIMTFRMGLSNESGEQSIYFNEDNRLQHEGLASLYPDLNERQSSEVIHLTTLDQIIVKQQIRRIDVIKIDVEGAEWKALQGSKYVLQKFKPVLMVEINNETAKKAGYEITEMVEWLRALNYEGHKIDKYGLSRLVKYPSFCNAVFIYHR